MTGTVVVIGSINVDLFAHVRSHPVPGETVLGTGGERAPGGKGANQALAARLQGAAVRLVGAVGDDSDAVVALGLLRQTGVDLSGVSTLSEHPTGLAIITVSEDGENTIVVISGANAAVPKEQALHAVERLHDDDILLMQGELPTDVTATIIRAARERGVRVALNLAPYVELPDDVLRLVDPLVVNELEAAAVARQLGLNTRSGMATARGLLDHGLASVVVTLGSRGSLLGDATGVTPLPAVRVTAIDTTGAGDAFTGALLARLAAGDGLVDAARHATRVGAYAVQHQGAQPSYPASEDELP